METARWIQAQWLMIYLTINNSSYSSHPVIHFEIFIQKQKCWNHDKISNLRPLRLFSSIIWSFFAFYNNFRKCFFQIPQWASISLGRTRTAAIDGIEEFIQWFPNRSPSTMYLLSKWINSIEECTRNPHSAIISAGLTGSKISRASSERIRESLLIVVLPTGRAFLDLFQISVKTLLRRYNIG